MDPGSHPCLLGNRGHERSRFKDDGLAKTDVVSWSTVSLMDNVRETSASGEERGVADVVEIKPVK